MVGKVKELRDRLNQEKGKKSSLMASIEALSKKLEKANKDIVNTEKAQVVAQIVAQQTQQMVEIQISSIVSLALSSVFADPYEFKAIFVPRRDKTECDLVFSKQGQDVDPMNASGGGVLDVASFALKMALWSLKKTQNVQVLDEPFKFVSRDLQPKISATLDTFSKELDVQFIIVSHIPEIIDKANKVFVVEGGEVFEDGISE